MKYRPLPIGIGNFEEIINSEYYYVEKSDTGRASLFDGLYISTLSEKYKKHPGAYPVISLCLKEGKQCTYSEALQALHEEIQREFSRHRHILSLDVLEDDEKLRYLNVLQCKEGHILLDFMIKWWGLFVVS